MTARSHLQRNQRARQPAALAFAALLFAAATFAAPAAAQTLRVGMPDIPASRGDPMTSLTANYLFVWQAIFDSLTEVDGKGVAQARLATSWENVSPTTWRFTLRPGVTFHNGAPFDADAVVNSVNYLISPEGAKNSGVVFASLRHLAGATRIDDRTVEIATKTPAPILPNEMAALRIVEPGAWHDLGRTEFMQQPVGSSFFEVTSWTDQGVEMTRFAESWRKTAIASVRYLNLPEPASRVQAFASHQIDIAMGVPPDSKAVVEAAGGRLNLGASPSIYVMLFNMQKPGPHQDVRVRQAMNYAVDKSFVDTLLSGTAVAEAQPAPQSVLGYQPDIEPYPYDPEKAKRLLAEAGVDLPIDVTAELVVTGGGVDVYEFVALNLKEVGINLTLLPQTLPDLLSKMRGDKEFQGEMLQFNYGAQPSMDMMRSINNFHSCSYPRKWTCFPEIEDEIKAVNAEFDPEKRAAGLRKIAQFYHDAAPAIWLHEQFQIDAVSGEVKNYTNDNYVISFEEMELSK